MGFNDFRAIGFALALLLASSAAMAQTLLGAEPVDRRHTEVTMVPEVADVAPGQSFTIALHMVPEPGWHSYWSNPGDSGLATSIEWTLPAGFSAGDIVYPAPTKIPFGPLMNYGYDAANTLLIDIKVPETLAGDVAIEASAHWLICDDEICVPEDSHFSLVLPVGDGAKDQAVVPLFAAAREALPKSVDWPARLEAGSDKLRLSVDVPTQEGVAEAWFYPLDDGIVAYAAPQKLKIVANQLQLTLSPAGGALPERVSGVLSLRHRDATAPEAFFVSAVSSTAPVGGEIGFFAALAMALVGGLILNLMPCVFPVLSLKALSLAKIGGDAGKARRSGLFYAGGVIASFLAIATVLILLRAAGAELGWGFQFQSPVVVALLALIMFAVGLNLIGAYEVNMVGSGLVGRLLARTQGDDAPAAFGSGVLATVVATPCTAPFMATALGYALVQPAGVALAVFGALGMGLALPYVLVATSPKIRALLPRPGAWMETFRQFLAFPMFAAAVWLVWVAADQDGPMAVLTILGGFLFLALAAWAYGRALRCAGRRRSCWRLVFFASLALAFGMASRVGAVPAEPSAQALVFEGFSSTRLENLRAEGKPVFVYFTAAWCITCKFNERLALESDEVERAFATVGVAVLRADWTRRDPEITAVLRAYGRVGIPLYLYFAPGQPAAILPQILTPGALTAIVQGGERVAG